LCCPRRWPNARLPRPARKRRTYGQRGYPRVVASVFLAVHFQTIPALMHSNLSGPVQAQLVRHCLYAGVLLVLLLCVLIMAFTLR